MTRVPFTTTWIEQGKILIGSIPQLPEDIHILKNMGIVTIISLTRRYIGSYPDLGQFFINDSLNIAHFPIPDGSIATDELMRDAAKSIDYRYKNNRSTYVHCRGGIGRSGMILQAYYILYRGMTANQARDMLRVRRNYEGNASAADQGSPQREWIDGLKS